MFKKKPPAAVIAFQRNIKVGVINRQETLTALSVVLNDGLWRECKDESGQSFETFSDWLLARQPHGAGVRDQDTAVFARDILIELGAYETWSEVLDRITRPPGNHSHSPSNPDQFYRVTTASAGPDRMLLRLKKKDPDVLKALYNGEYDSIRAAATAAGLITKAPPGHTCLETAAVIFTELPEERQVEFLVSLVAKLGSEARITFDAALRDDGETLV